MGHRTAQMDEGSILRWGGIIPRIWVPAADADWFVGLLAIDGVTAPQDLTLLHNGNLCPSTLGYTLTGAAGGGYTVTLEIVGWTYDMAKVTHTESHTIAAATTEFQQSDLGYYAIERITITSHTSTTSGDQFLVGCRPDNGSSNVNFGLIMPADYYAATEYNVFATRGGLTGAVTAETSSPAENFVRRLFYPNISSSGAAGMWAWTPRTGAVAMSK